MWYYKIEGCIIEDTDVTYGGVELDSHAIMPSYVCCVHYDAAWTDDFTSKVVMCSKVKDESICSF